MSTLATGLALGFVADRICGDPDRWHPVAGFGRLAAAVERRVHRDDRRVGAAYAVGLVTAAAALGGLITRRTPHPAARTLAVAVGTWTVLGGRTLEREAERVAARLSTGDLAGARNQVARLVGRQTAGLSDTEVVRACVESVAENSADAVVAPLLWGAVAGLPGLLGYRALNTLDAMIGHRSARYTNFGWAAARLDDLANLGAARVAAALVALLSRTPVQVIRTVRRDAGRHPSPNAGVVEAAFAAALGIRLGGANVYGGVREDRGVLGDGRSATAGDISRATDLAAAVSVGALALAVLIARARR